MTQERKLGRIVRLQIQTSSLKLGPPKGRYFDPAAVRQVEALEADNDGVCAQLGGQRVVDVHNATHPQSKNRDGINAISFGFTSHYQRMRQEFDEHLVNGIAGENILIECDERVELDDVNSGLVILGRDGRRVELVDISVAHPCVEFSRYALNDLAADPKAVSTALRFLDNGMRGYYAAVASGGPLRIEPGDRVMVIERATNI